MRQITSDRILTTPKNEIDHLKKKLLLSDKTTEKKLATISADELFKEEH